MTNTSRSRCAPLASLLSLLVCACEGGMRASGDAGPDGSGACVASGPRETSCGNLRDDDCDGFYDCGDIDCDTSSACMSACVPVAELDAAHCRNHVDDDCDGRTDCADPDCLRAGNPVCLGVKWRSSCTSVLGSRQRFVDHDFALLLTSSGASGTVTSSDMSITLEINLKGVSSSTTAVSLLAPPNDDLATCTHCFVMRRGGRTFYPRSATTTIEQMPAAVGDPFVAFLDGSFEEVTITNNRVTPVPNGECYVTRWELRGVAVSAATQTGLSGVGMLNAAATEGGWGQTGGSSGDPGGTNVCGDMTCRGTETPSSCTADCGCALGGKHLCPGGHACPSGAECLSQGRCECEAGMTALSCGTGDQCATGECTAGSAWTCTHLGCGITNFSVSCGNGTACPTNSTCSGGACVCDAGYLPTDCIGAFCTGQCVAPSWSCRRSLPGCGPSAFTVSCASGGYCPANSTCGASSCQCAAGYVPTSCDGVACSANAPCSAPYWFCAPE